MSWWNNSPDTILFPDEGYLIDRYPQHVARAFLVVDYDYLDVENEHRPWIAHYRLVEEAIANFAQRWGGIDDDTFLRVLREGTGRDRFTAIFALGHNPLPQAADVLVPFLHSTNPLERYATACVLGLKRDERALPILEDYFLHDPPIDEQGQPLPETQFWYSSYLSHLARVLATWGPASFTAILRSTFLRLWQHEYALAGYEIEYDTHDALLYALGRRGALAALHGVPLPEPRRRLAMLFLALGHLHAAERFADLHQELVIDRAVRAEVAEILMAHFALSEQESRACVDSFGEDYEWRVEASQGLGEVGEQEQQITDEEGEKTE